MHEFWYQFDAFIKSCDSPTATQSRLRRLTTEGYVSLWAETRHEAACAIAASFLALVRPPVEMQEIQLMVKENAKYRQWARYTFNGQGQVFWEGREITRKPEAA